MIELVSVNCSAAAMTLRFEMEYPTLGADALRNVYDVLQLGRWFKEQFVHQKRKIFGNF